jgi:hypothetical protein
LKPSKSLTIFFRLLSDHYLGIPFIAINSGAAFAAVIGPLVEVPVLISLVNVALGWTLDKKNMVSEFCSLIVKKQKIGINFSRS